jgi:RNA recognition motif-containing protein
MGAKLYVGNLPFSADENSVREFFTRAGGVQSVKIVTDPLNGRSRGFAFVEMNTDAEATSAIEQLNGVEMQGRPLRVDRARAREPKAGGGRPRPEGGPRY